MNAYERNGCAVQSPYGGRAAHCNRLRRLAAALILVAAPILFAPAQAREASLLAIGDSLVAGYNLPNDVNFTTRLEQALANAGRDVQVVNAGVSGDTSAGGLARIDWALAGEPDVVLLEFGGNDGLRGLDPADTRANLDAMIRRAQEAGAVVLLTGMMAPRNLGADYVGEFDSLYAQLAEEHDGVVFYPFFLEGVAADPSLNLDDGIHPNAAGVEVIVANILPYVIEALDRAADR